MELASNKEKKKIRATFPNGEIVFIQLMNVKVRDGHEGEQLTSCDLMIEGEIVSSWEILDWGGGTQFNPVGSLGNKYVGKLEKNRCSLDILINGNVYNSDFLEEVIQEILDCKYY